MVSMLWTNFISQFISITISHTHSHRHLGTYKVILTVNLVGLAQFEVWNQYLAYSETPPDIHVLVLACALLFPHLSLHLYLLYAVCPPLPVELELKEKGCSSA